MKRLLYVILALGLLSGTACSHSKKKKPSKAIATEVEEGFKQRWVARRMSEITAAEPNVEPREARRRAVADFKVRFSQTTAAKNADVMGDGTLP